MTNKDDIVKQEKPDESGGASGPKVNGGSRSARRTAALILDVLAGVCTTTQAAEVLDVSLPRYYTLESQGLEGLVVACEPKRQGRQVSAEMEMTKLRQEVDRLTRECSRKQSLLRAVQRTISIPDVEKKSKVKGKHKRRPTVRALKASRRLRLEMPEEVRTEADSSKLMEEVSVSS